MRKSLTTLLIGLFVTAAAASAVYAQGRAYVQRQRQIYAMAKAMDGDRREVKDFGNLLEDLDDCDLSESTRDFWRLARGKLKPAMERELAQINERAEKEESEGRRKQVEASVQKAEMGESAPLDSSEQSVDSPLVQRAHHMEMLYREAEGLRNPMVMADLSVVKRYRLLVGEFYDEMKADIAAREAEIDRLKKENRK
jgi:hypothetical protein